MAHLCRGEVVTTNRLMLSHLPNSISTLQCVQFTFTTSVRGSKLHDIDARAVSPFPPESKHSVVRTVAAGRLHYCQTAH